MTTVLNVPIGNLITSVKISVSITEISCPTRSLFLKGCLEDHLHQNPLGNILGWPKSLFSFFLTMVLVVLSFFNFF